MTTQEARDRINELLNDLWNSQDRHTDGDVQALIQALEEHVIPLLEERIEYEQIADIFIELGNPGPILRPEELDKLLKQTLSQRSYKC